MAKKQIEFNADMGEGFGVWALPTQIWRADLERDGTINPHTGPPTNMIRIMELVSSVNLACGFHGGDPYLIKRYVAAAKAADCSIGAHPSYPDVPGFGLRYMEMSSMELEAVIQYQLGALEGFLRMENMTLHHVKCHGALYNRAVKDDLVATAIAEAVAGYREGLPLYGFPYSCMEHAASRVGVPFVREAFSDRAYHADGRLVDRQRSDAMILDAAPVVKRVLEMSLKGTVNTVDGGTLTLDPGTICFHADTPAVIDFLESCHAALQKNEVSVTGRQQAEA